MIIRLLAYYRCFIGLLQKKVTRSYYERFSSYTGGNA